MFHRHETTVAVLAAKRRGCTPCGPTSAAPPNRRTAGHSDTSDRQQLIPVGAWERR